jgi:hypothetical protein
MTTRSQSSEALDPIHAGILETLGNPDTVAIGASEQRMEANEPDTRVGGTDDIG